VNLTLVLRYCVVLAVASGWVYSAAAQKSTAAATDPLQDAAAFQKILEDYVRLPEAPVEAGEQPAWRTDLEARLNDLLRRLEPLTAPASAGSDILLVKALCHARRADLLLDRRRDLDARFAELGGRAEAAIDDAAARDLAAQRLAAAQAVSAEYRLVDQTLERAIAGESVLAGQREMSLVRGVIAAQSAIVQERTIVSAEDAKQRFDADPALIRKWLDDAAGLLRDYVSKTPRNTGLEWLRGQYYLGVVQYRRSLKLPEPGKPTYTVVDTADPKAVTAFAEAREIFASLADADSVKAILSPGGDGQAAKRAYEESSFSRQAKYSLDAVAHFYAATANVYLGLIAAIDPAGASNRAEAARQAKAFLDTALEYDNSPPAEGLAPISLSSGAIPLSHRKVTTELEQVREERVERMPLNDFRLNWGLGYGYDTNVTLLGRNTEAPLDKRRKRDSRFPVVAEFDYTLDLDALKPGDESLKKWQIYVNAKTAPIWNLRIHDFNEQFYGGTINLRYEILGPGVVSQLDGLYLHARYDYEYFLLGNDGFLRTNRLRPMVQVLAFEGLLDAQFYCGYDDRNYLELVRDERFDRDGNYYNGGIDLNFDLGKWVEGEKLWGSDNWGPCAPNEDDTDHRRPLELRFQLAYNNNSTQGDEFDYGGPVLGGGVTFPFPLGINFSYSAAFEWQDYWQPSLIDHARRNREDFIQEHVFRVERTFFLSRYPHEFENINPLRPERFVMTVHGDIRFAIDDSNVRDRLGQSIFEYNRAVYAVGVSFGLN
jgi:hypothetical protein